ncbi:MAG: transglycosylase SLT domain-containing protein [Vampirovibrionales bacterium]|nr:transglycosylase SLT domain-containing protein [Vampirovibrionales bacterium]
MAKSLAGAALVAGVVALAWWGVQSGWNVSEAVESVIDGFQRATRTAQRDSRLFNPAQPLSLDAARALYRKSLSAQSQGDAKAALDGFNQLESALPALSPWILFHQAEALGAQGQEAAAQERLKDVIAQVPASPLHGAALYALGQSRLRARQEEAAREAFIKTRQQFGQSDYGIASLYYLGELAGRAASVEAAASGSPTPPRRVLPQAQLAFWREYLDKSPDGRFAFEIASTLQGALEAPAADDCRRISLGLASHGAFPKNAMRFFDCAPFQDIWLSQAMALRDAGEPTQSAETALRGLAVALDAEQRAKGVDLLVRLLPADQAAAALSKLRLQDAQKAPTAAGGDYVLWRLAELDSAGAPAYWQEILTRYPQGDYAPESGWRLMWRLIRSGQTQAYLAQSERHLQAYPHSQSAPQALFWRAKLLERRGARQDALNAYDSLLSAYPASYYAFRAYGRVLALRHGRPDPLWQTRPGRALPSAPEPGSDAVSMDSVPESLRSAAGELMAIGACDDLALAQTSSSQATASPSRAAILLKSACLHRAGDRAQGIRLLRENLDERARQGDRSAFDPSAAEMKLLYPLYFAPILEREARSNRIDPLLALSLTREESYFNEMAVSSSRALGLMQLMPATAGEVAGWLGVGGFQTMALFQPELNIRFGCRYLGHLDQTFPGQPMLMVGAYNGGPNAVKRWVSKSAVFARDPDQFVEEIPYDQTRLYIKKVFGAYWNYRRLYRLQ